ncbi:acyl-CoA thioesterase II [Gallaecimonas pentaromativorans]|uniref:Acyl-CoA thioesterase 2 n=1 Tax=Gallaecimonas pentaromativorans TaxID=584787 RepID=A0A3N1NY72_9GAMM|nr:acyl-CoA thioesterase II [Gallaecimonas pentaromativorans]ROQ24784.1 acyl-CoA thioesterase-2 [Gallaecimonas pentaromativorans]
MSPVLNELLSLLELEPVEKGIFRGQSQDLGFPALFGGQVLGQAMSAAQATVDTGRSAHSLHAYFLEAGDAKSPVVYLVENLRDGGTFSTRRVKAIQHGRPIFELTTSFQIAEEGFSHQDEMPPVPGPDGLKSERELAEPLAERLPKRILENFLTEMPIEMRPVVFHDPTAPEVAEPVRYVWIKANGMMPDDPRIHQYLLAYASDFNFLPTSLQPHGRSYMEPTLQVASIDHAMWFHQDFRMDDWLLYVVKSPIASGARGLVRGQFFDRQGRLVASTQQEGLIRQRKPKTPQ